LSEFVYINKHLEKNIVALKTVFLRIFFLKIYRSQTDYLDKNVK